MHTALLTKHDLVKLVTNSLSTILRRDMSLNRRVYSWLLGSEVQNANRVASYFDQHSKEVLKIAIRILLKDSIKTADLRPYKILLSLLDKVEIGPPILDEILIDMVRTVKLVENNSDVKKSMNSLFGNFDPSYIWNFLINQFEKACKKTSKPEEIDLYPDILSSHAVNEFYLKEPNGIEICGLAEFILNTLSLEILNETTRVFLPKFLFGITKIITSNVNAFSEREVSAAVQLCIKIIQHVEPMIL